MVNKSFVKIGEINFSRCKPLAITNCLNFGNPENKEIMGEFVECLEESKMHEFLNCLLFQEMYRFIMELIKNIYPTPVIGGVGLIQKLSKPLNHKFKEDNSILIIIGKTFVILDKVVFLEKIIQLIKDFLQKSIFLTKKIMVKVY